MAFPTTPVISTFTQADGDLSEGGLWAAVPTQPTKDIAEVISNQGARGTSPAGTATSHRVASYAEDQEVYATIAVVPATSENVSVFGRIKDPNTAGWDCYAIHYFHGTGWRMFRNLNGSFVQLGSTNVSAAAAGDGIGLEMIGDQISGWRRSSGVWARIIGPITDANITGAGQIGIEFNNGSAGRLDDFGGGTVVEEEEAVVLAPIGILGRGAGW